MWVTIVMLLMLVGSIVWLKMTYSDLAVICLVVSIFIAPVLVIVKVCQPLDYAEFVINYEVVRDAYDDGVSRNSMVDGAIALKAIEINQTIMWKRYWNERWMDWWIHDGYDTLPLIK
jgi:hypothetical protein